MLPHYNLFAALSGFCVINQGIPHARHSNQANLEDRFLLPSPR